MKNHAILTISPLDTIDISMSFLIDCNGIFNRLQFLFPQVCHNRPVPAQLKALTTSAMNLSFADFSVLSSNDVGSDPTSNSEDGCTIIHDCSFYPATWGTEHLPVTLMISKNLDLSGTHRKNSFSLAPIVQFCDHVPTYLTSEYDPQADASCKGTFSTMKSLFRLISSLFAIPVSLKVCPLRPKK